jgi:hypothetical protein
MPDGKPYRGMRGGNWYNGYKTTSVNDGHSRVSNRNPSYYRGPQDPNHPWYHVGFRVVRNYSISTGIGEIKNVLPESYHLYQNYPNPFNPTTTISFDLPIAGNARIDIFNPIGQMVKTVLNRDLTPGSHSISFDASQFPSGLYFYQLRTKNFFEAKKMIYLK